MQETRRPVKQSVSSAKYSKQFLLRDILVDVSSELILFLFGIYAASGCLHPTQTSEELVCVSKSVTSYL